MNIYYTIDEKYMQAADKIYWGKYPKAKLLLEEILEADPAYGNAHYLLACIYYQQLADFNKAMMHFAYAIKFAPQNPEIYLHYLYLLRRMERHDELLQVAKISLEIKGTNKCYIYGLIGESFELRKDWDNAIANYKEAQINAIEDSEMEQYKTCISRILEKTRLIKKWYYSTN